MQVDRKALVVYYSRSGTTSPLADMLAGMLPADCEPIRERAGPARREGVRGFARSIADVVWRRRVELEPSRFDVSRYEMVVIGTPVWASCACAPVATWLADHARQLRHVAFFCSEGGRGSEKAFTQMSQLARISPVATCAVSARDLHTMRDYALLNAFAAKVRRRLAALEMIEWTL
jgi:menaquinone-dependent protoporphyrinogen IX oxidase